MFNKLRGRIAKFVLGVVTVIPLFSLVTYAAVAQMSNSSHVYDTAVTLSANQYVGRSYTLAFDGNKPAVTRGTVQNIPATQQGNLSFKEWSVVATHNSGNYNASVNLGVKNFEHVAGNTSVATAQWNNVSLPFGNPSLIGYNFLGWYTQASGGSVVNSPIMVTPATTAYSNTIYAHWSPITYTIRYNGNNTSHNIYGDPCSTNYTGSTADTRCTYDVTSTVSNSGFSKTGYTFKHWNTRSDNSGNVVKPGDSILNWTTTDNDVITLYAIWEPNRYNVNVHNNKPSDSTGNIVNVK